jgi:HD-like signal output (HDOD) protein
MSKTIEQVDNTKPSVLLVLSSKTDARTVVEELSVLDIEPVVARNAPDAVWQLRDQRFDMIIVETGLEGTDGLKFLSQTRKHLPDMQRIIFETREITQSWHSIINDIAPAALFKEVIDAKHISRLLETDDPHKGMTRVQEEGFIAEVAADLNRMLRDPDLKLPILPEIAKKVNALLDDESNSFDEIAEWVRNEPAMSARILQVANSPIYCAREPIRNISQAVSRMGLRKLRQLLQAVIVENLFHTNIPARREMMKDLWLHSLATGYCNEAIAQFLSIPDSDDYFLMGLLHDIGKLLILRLLDIGVQKRTWKADNITLDITEKLILLRHNDLGARLVSHWSYPFTFQEVIRRHNDSRYADFHSEPVIVTHFSDTESNKLDFKFCPHDAEPLTPQQIAESLNLDSKTLRDMECNLTETMEKLNNSCFAEGPTATTSAESA